MVIRYCADEKHIDWLFVYAEGESIYETNLASLFEAFYAGDVEFL